MSEIDNAVPVAPPPADQPQPEFEPFTAAQQLKIDEIVKKSMGRAGREAKIEAASERRKRENLERVLNDQYKNPDNSKLELEMELQKSKNAEADLRAEVLASRKNAAISKSFKDLNFVDRDLASRLISENVSYNSDTKQYEAHDDSGAAISLEEAAKQFAASHPYLVYSGMKSGQDSTASQSSSLTADSAESLIRSVLGTKGYGHRLHKRGSKSCGCILREAGVARRKHGHAGSTNRRPSPEYKAYEAAKRRCSNPNAHNYKNYGGRGIEFRFQSFLEFFAEIGPRPQGMSLNRIDNDGNYDKGNVAWSSASAQAANRRTPKKKPSRVVSLAASSHVPAEKQPQAVDLS